MIPAQLRAWAGAVPKPDASAVKECRRRMDAIAKPLDGLGLFEEMIARMAGMQRTAQVGIAKAKLPVFCADNGIVEEGVAQSDASVTAAVALSLGRGTSSVCRMAKEAGIDVLPVDIGMQKDVP